MFYMKPSWGSFRKLLDLGLYSLLYYISDVDDVKSYENKLG